VLSSRRQGVAGELVGTIGRVPGKEGTGGALRGWQRNDGVERPAWDSGVLVEGSSGDRRGVRRGPVARGGHRGVRKCRLMVETGGSRGCSAMNGERWHGAGGILYGPVSSVRW
jgi:hypothetical protein